MAPAVLLGLFPYQAVPCGVGRQPTGHTVQDYPASSSSLNVLAEEKEGKK